MHTPSHCNAFYGHRCGSCPIEFNNLSNLSLSYDVWFGSSVVFEDHDVRSHLVWLLEFYPLRNPANFCTC
jgi:hypothetical protein